MTRIIISSSIHTEIWKSIPNLLANAVTINGLVKGQKNQLFAHVVNRTSGKNQERKKRYFNMHEYIDNDYFTQEDLEQLETIEEENNKKAFLLKELLVTDITLLTA